MTHRPNKFGRRFGAPLQDFFQGMRRSPWAFAIFFSALLTPALLVLIFVVILPVAHNPYEAEPPSSSEEIEEHNNGVPESTTILDSARTAKLEELSGRLLEMDVRQAFLRSRWVLAKGDSISLTVDLRDSLINLEMKGTPIRQCRVLRYEMSRALERLQAKGRLHEWLATPFVLQNDLATLAKTPIRVITAPRDTLEAQARAKEKIPIEKSEVHFALQFDRNLTLSIEQAQDLSFRGKLKKWAYDLRRSSTATQEALQALWRNELPQHRMLIELELSQEDAKAIYRALPSQVGLALYF